MNKTIYILILSMFIITSCSVYRTSSDKAHIVYDDKYYNKFYVNDSLKIVLELPPTWLNSTRVYDLGLEKTSKVYQKILSMAKVDPKNDLLLFADSKTVVVRRTANVDLTKYRAFSLKDSAITKDLPIKDGGVFRQIKVDKRTKIMTVDDLMPFANGYLSVISYYDGGYKYSQLDPTDPNDYLPSFRRLYDSTLVLSRKNAIQINNYNPPKVTSGFDLLSDYFQTGEYCNYYAPVNADARSGNYYDENQHGMFRQMIATYYGFAQESHKSDSVWKLLVQAKDNEIFEKTSDLSELFARVDTSQVVMFNEAHNAPQHRYLVGSLLAQFKQRGFNYLGLEAFATDSSFEQRKYPTMDNGFYLRDPVFGDLVREAASMGMTVFGFDCQGADRETVQAKNIISNTLAKDPKARILVLCGYDHIHSDRMAGKFRELTGIKPLTIDQSSAYLCYLDNPSKTNKVYIVTDQNFTGRKRDPNATADIFLWNDLTVDDNVFGLEQTKQTSISVPLNTALIPRVLCIYKKQEFDNYAGDNKKIPIPVFVRIIGDKIGEVTCKLSLGEYKICFFDCVGEIVTSQDLIVK